MARYNLHIPSFHIKEVRSAGSDKLFASTALKVMNPNGSLHRDYGSKGVALNERKAGGDVVPGLTWENVEVPDPTLENPDGGAMYWTFVLVNNGHGDSPYVAMLNKVADAWAGALAGKAIDKETSTGSGILLFLGSAVIIVAQEALNLLTANCDGGVA